MAENTHSHPNPLKVDSALAALAVILLGAALFNFEEFSYVAGFALKALANTAPFIFFAVLAVAYVKATGAENVLAKAFEGAEARMVILAALLGGLSPFCSCEVIPFIAALLAVGAPLSAVMAFWLASPLMDPAMFLITSGTLGWEFALGKTMAAVGIGLFGGAVTMIFAKSVVFADPLREKPKVGGCCGVKAPFQDRPQWSFWRDAERVEVFKSTTIENAVFLLKWLSLAYVIEALMLRHVPADWIASALGGQGVGTILLGALVGAPAYLNGYAAVPLVDALIQQGMSAGAAMSFMLAGGVSCIPAAIAVWALVKPRVFVGYIAYGVVGATIAGLIWQMLA